MSHENLAVQLVDRPTNIFLLLTKIRAQFFQTIGFSSKKKKKLLFHIYAATKTQNVLREMRSAFYIFSIISTSRIYKSTVKSRNYATRKLVRFSDFPRNHACDNACKPLISQWFARWLRSDYREINHRLKAMYLSFMRMLYPSYWLY